MQVASHQTVRLSKGKHTSPKDGVCVMELASMLAGERFSDHPLLVSRPIAALLRGYNDWLDDDDKRQDLYAYASRVVGTAAGSELEDARTDAVVAWADELWSRPRDRSIMRWLRGRRERRPLVPGPESAARYAINALTRSDEMHAEVLAKVDDLAEMGTWPASRADRGRPGRTAPHVQTVPAAEPHAGSR